MRMCIGPFLKGTNVLKERKLLVRICLRDVIQRSVCKVNMQTGLGNINSKAMRGKISLVWIPSIVPWNYTDISGSKKDRRRPSVTPKNVRIIFRHRNSHKYGMTPSVMRKNDWNTKEECFGISENESMQKPNERKILWKKGLFNKNRLRLMAE